MAQVLKGVPFKGHPNLLVGFNQADDAGVYKINESQALVQTVDFFPPIVDDPYQFGQVAAANALSDIYAMGGKPMTALNIVGFPPKMRPEVLSRILLGGADKIQEADAVVVGGHSIKNNELVYGVSATGMVDIDKIISNDKAKAGDRLFLTKPIGTGIITTAIKQGKATDKDTKAVIEQMSTLNKQASELMQTFGAHSATDITGYGILGHAHEMAEASGVSIEMEFSRIPIIAGAVDYAELGALTGGANANKEYLEDKVEITLSLLKAQIDILYDAQTSGGLLIAFGSGEAEKFIAEAEKTGLKVHEIGHVIKKQEKTIIVC